jgi:cation transport ATPase
VLLLRLLLLPAIGCICLLLRHPSGSLSTDGLLVVRVEATAENSTPSRIAQMAADAQVKPAACFTTCKNLHYVCVRVVAVHLRSCCMLG